MGIAHPLTWALLIEVASLRRGGAASRLAVAYFAVGTVTAVLSRLAGVVAIATPIHAALAIRAVGVCAARVFADTIDRWVVTLTLWLFAVLVVGTVGVRCAGDVLGLGRGYTDAAFTGTFGTVRVRCTQLAIAHFVTSSSAAVGCGAVVGAAGALASALRAA